MSERLECRSPWVTKKKETATAWKPSRNLVITRVHGVPSNHIQPILLHFQLDQSVLDTGAGGRFLSQRAFDKRQ